MDKRKYKSKYKSMISRVDDGFNYFNSGILEELTTDKKYYVRTFMDYIEELESKLKKIQSDYNKPFTLMTYHDSVGEVFHDICTNDPKKYLKRLNEDRIADGEEEEDMSSYTLTNIHIETFKNK
tara:strand:+ start:303 stop:674 length:372 start_codon:yes stop_codon:yes gene_type:complete